MNAILIASLVVHARVNTQGSLETPFYKYLKYLKKKELFIYQWGKMNITE
jgi:hypothetical protein